MLLVNNDISTDRHFREIITSLHCSVQFWCFEGSTYVLAAMFSRLELFAGFLQKKITCLSSFKYLTRIAICFYILIIIIVSLLLLFEIQFKTFRASFLDRLWLEVSLKRVVALQGLFHMIRVKL